MKLSKSNERLKERAARPQWTLANAFLGVILVGTLLLHLPFAGAGGQAIPLYDAFFMATSATCVTGLSVIDIGTRLSLFGQGVLLALVQIGGLGIMSFATFTLVLLRRRLSVHSESVLSVSFGEGEAAGGWLTLLRGAVLFTLVIEGLGTVLLTWRHWETGMPPLRAAYYGLFHAVCAFCNAGFSLFPDNLTGLGNDPFYGLTVCLLIGLGGLGFLVLQNLSRYKFWRRGRLARGRISAHSRMVLQTSLLLSMCGALLYAALEWNHALAGRGIPFKALGALFQSVSSRTAGFNIVDMAAQTEPASFLTMVLMFIGGSPGSTAGGIKTTTLTVLVLTAISMIHGRSSTLYGTRAIPETIVREAIAIFLLATFFIALTFGLLLITETGGSSVLTPLPLMFETVSAFGTTGLSLDVTPRLSGLGRLLIIIAMFVGRLGPLSIVLLVGSPGDGDHVRYPEEEVVVG